MNIILRHQNTHCAISCWRFVTLRCVLVFIQAAVAVEFHLSKWAHNINSPSIVIDSWVGDTLCALSLPFPIRVEEHY